MATVVEHYERSDALANVRAALDRIAPDGRQLGIDELAGFDHFHTAGVLATERMAELLASTPADTVLDAGAGLGGPARYLAARFGCRVMGIDLTPLFVDVGRLLSVRTGFDGLVDLQVGDVDVTLPTGQSITVDLGEADDQQPARGWSTTRTNSGLLDTPLDGTDHLELRAAFDTIGQVLTKPLIDEAS